MFLKVLLLLACKTSVFGVFFCAFGVFLEGSLGTLEGFVTFGVQNRVFLSVFCAFGVFLACKTVVFLSVFCAFGVFLEGNLGTLNPLKF